MNTTPARTRSGAASLRAGRATKMSNLIPHHSNNKENRQPQNRSSTTPFFSLTRQQKSKKRRRSHSSDDSSTIWRPASTKKAKRNTRSSSSSTQTPQYMFTESKPIPHAEMHNLQLDGNFTDKQMRIIARFIRKNTIANAIAPLYEKALTDQHDMFTDLYDTITYTPPTADADPIPLVICNDTKALLRRIESHHNRTVRLVKHGVDAGTYMLYALMLSLSRVCMCVHDCPQAPTRVHDRLSTTSQILS